MNCKKCDVEKILVCNDLRCPACWKATQRRNYDKRKSLMQEQHKTKRRILRLQVINYLLTHPCVDCGESNPILLTFDHLHSKKFEIHRAVHMKSRWEDIKAEIAKCDIRCVKCHKLKTVYQNGEHKWIFNDTAVNEVEKKIENAKEIIADFIRSSGLESDKYSTQN